jgi:hypothetical protein
MNAGSELLQGNGLSAVHWDDILHRGGRCLAIATDDSHYPGQDSRLAWTMAAAPEPTREAVLAVLRDGDLYATSGAVILGIEVDAGGIEVRCGAITRARFEPPEHWKWGRVEVVSAEGPTAWSNPFAVC